METDNREYGWIKAFRSLMDWEWWGDERMVKFWLYLLLKANHKPKPWQGRIIERGQVATSIKHLSRDTRFSEQTCKTFIKRLKSTHEITSQSTNHYTLITIMNYETYQNTQSPTNEPINEQTNFPLTNHQPQLKNIRKEEVIKEQPSAGFSNDRTKEIFEIAKGLKERFPDVGKFVGAALKSPSINHDALIYTLEQYRSRRFNIKDPWPYCMNILSKQNQNFNFNEHQQEHEELKKDKKPLSQIINSIGGESNG